MALTSIVEVKVETALISEEPPSNTYLIALICFIIIGLCAASVAGFLYLRQRRRNLGLSGINLSPSTETCHRNHEDEKNNLQNEENLRRYANPLKDDVGSTSMASINSASGCSLDIQKVSVVRPLSTLIPHENTSEMLEMISETDCQSGRKSMSTTSTSTSGSVNVTGNSVTNQNALTPSTSSAISDNNHHNHHHNHHNHHTLKISENLNLTSDGLKPTHRNSQIMLYKAQNPDVRKNTAAFDDTTTHKDFSKSVINVNKQRTLPHPQQQPQQNVSGGANDVLTVLV